MLVRNVTFRRKWVSGRLTIAEIGGRAAHNIRVVVPTASLRLLLGEGRKNHFGEMPFRTAALRSLIGQGWKRTTSGRVMLESDQLKR